MDKEGSVFIKWVDKTVSKVKPQELYKIDAEVGISLCLCFLYIGFNGLLVDFYFKKEIITRMKNKYYKAIKV